MSKIFFQMSLILVLLLAFVLRFWQLGQVPKSLYWDEVAMLVDAKSVSQTGKDMHGLPWYQAIYPSYGDYKMPVYIWLASLAVRLFGVNNWALRLPSAVAGVGAVFITGVLAKQAWLLGTNQAGTDSKDNQQKLRLKNLLFAQQIQLSTSLVVALSPWSIYFSRTGFEAHLGQLFLSLSILGFLWLVQVKTIKQKWQKWAITLLVPVLGAVATYSYFSVRYVWVPVLVLFLLALLIKRFLSLKQLLFLGIFNLMIYGVLLIPLYRSPHYRPSNQFRFTADSILNSYDWPVQSNQLRAMAGNQWIDRLFFHRHWLLLKALVINISRHLSFNFLFVNGDSNLRHGTGEHGLFLLPLLPLFLIGLCQLWARKKPLFVMLLGWWLIALVPASVPLETPHALRSLNALVPIAIILGVGLTSLLSWALVKPTKVKFMKVKKLALVFYSFWWLSCLSQFVYHYFGYYVTDAYDAWQGNNQALAERILSYPEKQNWFQPADDRFYLWLMAYGAYTGEDFQKWQSQDYKFNQYFNEIYFTASSGR